MSDSTEHSYVEWIAREAQRPVVTDPAARARIMAAVRAEPKPRRSFFALPSSLFVPRFSFSPVTSALLAAGLVGIGVLAGAIGNNWGVRKDGRATLDVAQLPPVSHATD